MTERGDRADWSELDSDPTLQKYIVAYLQTLLCDRRFPGSYHEHDYLTWKKAQMDEFGEMRNPENEEEVLRITRRADENPLIPEIPEFEQKVLAIQTVEGLKAFALEHKIEITAEDMEEAKKNAMETMQGEDKE